jgi:SAM-dependent methyltransferase
MTGSGIFFNAISTALGLARGRQTSVKSGLSMHLSDLHVLRCPFCGGSLALERNSALQIKGEEMRSGVIWCECSAYPVVDGIPYLRSGPTTREVLALLESGHKQEALARLGIPAEAQRPLTFRDVLPLLCSGAEAEYLLYRFSDPTFLVSDGLLRAVAKPPGRCLDLCGGAGHLIRGLLPTQEPWLADLEFWKLWLAKRIVAPECHAVCCDASQPLPFARGGFSFVFSSDGLNYIWQKRLFVAEATRVMAENGVLILTHLHNALCDNHSPGMPLTPAAYRNLCETLAARLFKESEFFESVLQKRPLDLSLIYKDADLRSEAAVILMAAEDPKVFRAYQHPPPYVGGYSKLAINPLYQVQHAGDKTRLRLRFPSQYYEQEFGKARSYLPEELELDTRDLNQPELIDRRVVLPLPDNY